MATVYHKTSRLFPNSPAATPLTFVPSLPADDTRLSLEEILNSRRSAHRRAKRAGECLAGREWSSLQTYACRAVPAAKIVVGLGKRWPVRLVLVPVRCLFPDIARAVVDGDLWSVLAVYHFVDEAPDLIPTS